MRILFQRNTDMFTIAQVENLAKSYNLNSMYAPHLYQTALLLRLIFYEKS
jgi:hypothetical protein